jgi:adenine-specific DNA-methyltransferase
MPSANSYQPAGSSPRLHTNKENRVKKIQPGEPETMSQDVVTANIKQLRVLFPEAWKEGKLDFDVLKQLLGGIIDDQEEKYGLNWHGKRNARRLALTPSEGTLRPCPEESVDWDTTKNLMIEGDNLEVLKLLQKSYAGRIKMIYIDPPYNTGKDFVYPDSFRDSIKNYQILTGQMDGEGFKHTSNPETSGRFHTDWLSMLYPRLKLARNLLKSSGVIFITIDDTEVANLRLVCDEIFGSENFVANVVWQKKFSVSADDPGIGSMHDHILVYQKSSEFDRGLLPRTEQQTARYSNPDDDPRGPWTSGEYVSSKSKDERPTLWYPIRHPLTGQDVWPDEHAVWRYSREKHEKMESENRLYWGPELSYKKPRLKRFINEIQDGVVPPSWWSFQDCGHNDEAQKETVALMGPKVFSTPKPRRLIDRMLTVANAKDDFVLDFFAGSGTTGHAVMGRNAADQGKRRFILVQLPEPLLEDDSTQKLAAQFCSEHKLPPNIAELTKERLRRAGREIQKETPQFKGDLGFRVFKLDSSNINAWEPNDRAIEQTLIDSIEHIKSDRDENDVLYELLLKLGLDLCVSIEEKVIVKKVVHSIGAGALVVCLATNISRDEAEPLALGIIAWHKEQAPAGESMVVFRDSAFADDVTKTNVTAILQQHGLDNVRSL